MELFYLSLFQLVSFTLTAPVFQNIILHKLVPGNYQITTYELKALKCACLEGTWGFPGGTTGKEPSC